MSIKELSLVGIMCLITNGTFAQDKNDSVNTGEDLLRPLSRFDIRSKYQQTSGDAGKSLVTFRVIVPFAIESGWNLSTRVDVPVIQSNRSGNDNLIDDYEISHGDLLTQFLFISPRMENRAHVFGMRLIWPTSSQDQMGSGKYQLAPTLGANYYPENWSKNSYLGIRVREQFDYAGREDRADIHQTSIIPGFSYNLKNYWFISSLPNIRINWKQGNSVFVPINLTVGKLLSKTKVMSVEFNTPIVNDYDLYDWEIEFRIGFFF